MTLPAPPALPGPPSLRAEPDLRSVVEQGLDLTWQVDADRYDLGLDALAGLALRDNPRRAQLVVSRLLGKHLPVAPPAARGAGLLLAGEVARVLGAPGPRLSARALTDPAVAARAVGAFDAAPLVLGFCETATALGHLVAEAFSGAAYVHTTRRPDPSVPVAAGFEEEHSHAVGHVLQLSDGSVLADPTRPLVLVDDELTTGTTALNTIAALHPRAPRSRYVLATLLDLRPAAAREAFAARAERLGVQVEVVSLLSGALLLPDDVPQRAAELRRRLEGAAPAPLPAGGGAPVTQVDAGWPRDLPRGGRTGTGPELAARLEDALQQTAHRVAAGLSGGPVLVLGTEELMWAPLRIAAALPGPVRYHSTTRSPVLPADLPSYAVRRVLRFPAPDEPARTSRLHGLPDEPYADVVVVTDTPAAAARSLAEALRPWASARVQVVAL